MRFMVQVITVGFAVDILPDHYFLTRPNLHNSSTIFLLVIAAQLNLSLLSY